MKRILGNDSSNSFVPPSAEAPWKTPNTYNGRKTAQKRRGVQQGHKGTGLSKVAIENKIREGAYVHKIGDIGDVGRPYVTRYLPDLDVKVAVTEIRIHADENGKYDIPDSFRANVFYGDTVKADTAYLYSEGVVFIDRICGFINALSGNAPSISAGSVYSFCGNFAENCAWVCPAIEETLFNLPEICTDATTVMTDRKQSCIRNFSAGEYVLYQSVGKKDPAALRGFEVLEKYARTLTHDHETVLYYFDTNHGECNVHLVRYLWKNTEETGNP